MSLMRPVTHSDALQKNRRGAASNKKVADGIAAAGARDPQIDRSAENARRAKSEGWSTRPALRNK